MPDQSSKNLGSSLAGLKIDRSGHGRGGGSRWARYWIVIGVLAIALFGAWTMFTGKSAALEVEVVRVKPQTAGESGDPVVLDASGYIVAHHKIEVASKVVGRVASIGVEKGDSVEKGQAIVRLENDEYSARVKQFQGNMAALQARLAEFQAGSRPEEIALAKANLEEARADLENARVRRDRSKELVNAGVVSEQEFDDAQARLGSLEARVASLDRAFDLMRIGPRKESIDAVIGQVKQAEGELEYAQTMLEAAVIRSPIKGTILERNVEIGEFVTTSFVGERGAKGYVVSLADLNDLQVELDISQNDFAKLSMGQKARVTTDAYRDRPYEGEIVEISPEADRQKATVQVKVQILKPDGLLRPEMNANVQFIGQPGAESSGEKPAATIVIPSSALRDGNSVFVVANGKAIRKQVTIGNSSSRGAEVTSGLIGGEDVIVNPPEKLEDGGAVVVRGG